MWLFGGSGLDASGNNGLLNDLWEFNPTLGTWAWVSGSNSVNDTAVYGSIGVPSPANVPGPRLGAVSWTDSLGNLWLFGGSASGQVFNDLWEFNPTAGTWVWVGGSSTGNEPGTYGTQGIAAIGNVPGARSDAASWTDSSGNFWLFGGFGFDQSVSGHLNDLWKFNPTAGTWEWVSGSNTADTAGVYGTLGVAATGNMPGARSDAMAWADSSGNLWLFGGANGITSFSDLWRFNPTTMNWTWVNGANTGGAAGVYGTLDVVSTSNSPGARSQAIAFTDAFGNLWLFGGLGNASSTTPGLLNDLWRYTP
jgi:N-acetylneuraminic acid mutarotase